MATYNKHNQFIEDVMHGVHDFTDTTGDDLVPYLHATVPVDTDEILATLAARGAGIVTTNIGTLSFPKANRTSGQTGGAYLMLLEDLVLTATGAVADFRYAGFYNDTPAGPVDPVIGWWDYGSTITGMTTDETFTYNFTTSTFTAS